MPVVNARTPRDTLPNGRLAGAAAYVLGERYVGLRGHLAGADIVHAAELGTWFSAQAARLQRRAGSDSCSPCGTIPGAPPIAGRGARLPAAACFRAVDLCLAATEGPVTRCCSRVPADRIEVAPPGIDIDRFATPRAEAGREHVILSAGRLVWEKGHQDVLRAFAALRRGVGGPPRADVRLLIVGDGPEEAGCAATPQSSGSRPRSSSAPPCPMTRCPESTPVPPRSCSPRSPARRGRNSSEWCSSRRWRPARQSWRADRVRSPRCRRERHAR